MVTLALALRHELADARALPVARNLPTPISHPTAKASRLPTLPLVLLASLAAKRETGRMHNQRRHGTGVVTTRAS